MTAAPRIAYLAIPDTRMQTEMALAPCAMKERQRRTKVVPRAQTVARESIKTNQANLLASWRRLAIFHQEQKTLPTPDAPQASTPKAMDCLFARLARMGLSPTMNRPVVSTLTNALKELIRVILMPTLTV